ncbi:MAG: putative flavoprotein (TIGR03862 family) [Candidatus Poriferisodalaceae bacterium]
MIRLAERQRTAVVVGGGPAGLIAAEVLAEAGLAVTVYDHKRSFGRKFLLAGRGGLNITHSEPLDALVARYGSRAGRLESIIRRFSPDDLRSWCAGLGEPAFVGSSGRVFPESLRATPLLRAWLERLADRGVEFRRGHRWLGWSNDSDGSPLPASARFRGADGSSFEVAADVVVMALGGASWPRVGSDGSWVGEFERHGVVVVPLAAANCGVEVPWTPEFAGRFAGTPLKNVAVSTGGESVRGDPIVTANGLEGGPIYPQSAALRDALAGRGAEATLMIDLQPDLTVEALTRRLTDRKRAKDSLSTWLKRAGFAPVAVGLLREATGNQLPTEASRVAALAQEVRLSVSGLMPLDRAISTAGGVSFDEVDDRLMLSRLPGCFVAGEMLDWEAPTGGYLLQASFSTGVTAALGALDWLEAARKTDTEPAEANT